ncbi:hypothetical protein J6590_077004 [Homalodisca vitripennis]|nr:hypothetical protein J6590_077004 [Homalodisca vitripennis]
MLSNATTPPDRSGDPVLVGLVASEQFAEQITRYLTRYHQQPGTCSLSLNTTGSLQLPLSPFLSSQFTHTQRDHLNTLPEKT